MNEAIRLDPNSAGAYRALGDDYSLKEDYDRAIENYDQAIRLNPKNKIYYYARGSAYYDKGNYDFAIQNYNEAIRLDPNFAPAYGRRGDAYFVQSNLTAAVSDFEQTISSAPSSNDAIFSALTLHVIMRRQGRNDAEQLAKVSAATDLSKWPGLLLKLDMGQMTADEAMTAAAHASPDIRVQKFQVCEATYLTGEDALIHHQRATALVRLKAARDNCPKRSPYYGFAVAELKRLGATASPAK